MVPNNGATSKLCGCAARSARLICGLVFNPVDSPGSASVARAQVGWVERSESHHLMLLIGLDGTDMNASGLDDVIERLPAPLRAAAAERVAQYREQLPLPEHPLLVESLPAVWACSDFVAL